MQDSRAIRLVDRHIGSFACTAITWLRAPFRALGAQNLKPSAPGPKKILLVELFEMGAAIMLLPTIADIKKKYPDAEIHCLVTKSCVPVWEAIRAIDRDKIHVMESGSAFGFLWSAFKVLLRLRAIRFDLILDYELFMRISVIFIGCLRARQRAGFYKYKFEGLSRGDFYETRCAYNQNSHISRNYLSLTRAALQKAEEIPNYKDSIALDDILIQPVLPKASSAEIVGIFKTSYAPYFLVCPDVGKTLSVRNYPRESFAKVIRELLRRYPSHYVVMIGTADNNETAEAILSQVGSNDRTLNLCGKTGFSDLLKVISGADLLITNDNGPGHFSVLTGTKTLALFSTDSPFVYGPLGDAVIAYTHYQCSPCISAYNHKASSCNNNRCLQALAPETVIDLADQMMKGQVRYRTINGSIPYVF